MQKTAVDHKHTHLKMLIYALREKILEIYGGKYETVE